MHNRLFLLIFLSFFSLTCLLGQSKFPLKFQVMEYDFGLIKEVDGKVSKRFSFQNVSKQSVQLTGVHVACGCTTPAWPKNVLLPSDTSSILITFDPTDRPGKFDKYIRVEIENIGEPMYLIIKGEVFPRPPGPRDWYPFRLGNLWFKHQNGFVGTLYQDETGKLDNVVYNAGDEPIEILLKKTKSELPKFIALDFDSLWIPPKDSVHFQLIYQARKRKSWGFVSDHFKLQTTDQNKPVKDLGAGVILQERFKEGGKKVPKLVLSENTYTFGELPTSTKKKLQIRIKNEGNKRLIFRRLKWSSCNCMRVSLSKKSIRKNQTATLEVELDTTNLYGWQSLTVTLITNDPKKDLVDLRIEGNIVEKETK